jgi:hypothetical protein
MATPAAIAAARLGRANKVAELAAQVRQASPPQAGSVWLPTYDKRMPERMFLHGSDSAAIEGPFVPGRRDSGWFGRGMYGTVYPSYASRWGKNLYASPMPDIKWAELWTDYHNAAYDPLTKHAHDVAGGDARWNRDERGYSQAFRDALMDKGVQGVRVHLGDHPDAELVVFDPEESGIRLSPFASRRENR